jgi:radical SAM superfamily enzyme with C-terminal helix-hairpin-helix motif
MLVDETKKPEPQPGRIKRLFDSIKQLAPEVASILSSAAKIGELIRG